MGMNSLEAGSIKLSGVTRRKLHVIAATELTIVTFIIVKHGKPMSLMDQISGMNELI